MQKAQKAGKKGSGTSAKTAVYKAKSKDIARKCASVLVYVNES
jgi:hypothetical protein